jgi:hypothetical protein
MDRKKGEEVAFCIGGLKIALDLGDYPVKSVGNGDTPGFMRTISGGAHARYRLHLGCPDSEPGKPAFQSKGGWKIHKDRGRRVVYSEHLTGFRTVCVLGRGFRRGDIYLDFAAIDPAIGRKRISQAKSNPLSYPVDHLLVMKLLAENRGVILHSSGVLCGRRGLLFVGDSGAGKSTISRLWTRNGGEVLGDDKIIARLMGRGVRIYGTPWHSTHKVCSNKGANLEAIFFICHGGENRIERMRWQEAAIGLFQRSFSNIWDEGDMSKSIDVCASLARRVRCYRLFFTPDSKAIEFLRKVVRNPGLVTAD